MGISSKPDTAGGNPLTRRGLLKCIAQGAAMGTTCGTMGMAGATTLANMVDDFSRSAPPAPTYYQALSLRIQQMTQMIEDRAAQICGDQIALCQMDRRASDQ